jgi:hypothetical protein
MLMLTTIHERNSEARRSTDATPATMLRPFWPAITPNESEPLLAIYPPF